MKNLLKVSENMEINAYTFDIGDDNSCVGITAAAKNYFGSSFCLSKVKANIPIINVGDGKKTLKFNCGSTELPYAYLAKYFLINSGADKKSTLRDNIHIYDSVKLDPNDIKRFYNIYSKKSDKKIRDFCKNIKCIYPCKMIDLSDVFGQNITITDVRTVHEIHIESDQPISLNSRYTVNICDFLDVVISVRDYRETLFDTSAIITIDFNFKNMDNPNSLSAFNLSVDTDRKKIYVAFAISMINYAI